MTLASKSVCDGETVNNAEKLAVPNNQILLACILLVPKDAAPLLALLKQVDGNSGPSTTEQIADVRTMNSPRPQSESWLTHPEAANYLGVSKSTLYRFACEGRIETRKLGGRLEYSRLTLDKFKEQQIRPARRPRTRGIITPTLGSGK
ncbi:MAG TPA: helix-turn-helix domain-containing protein [Candidatus Dormibacteraeota bacterium]|nr:helix-turn-helix domain-containing protein [Candidatus Dormibacteraeota bacterium]